MVHGFPCIFKCPAFVFKRKGTEPFVFVLLKIKNPKIPKIRSLETALFCSSAGIGRPDSDPVCTGLDPGCVVVLASR